MIDCQLKFVCPRCGKKLSPIQAMEHATLVVRRKCRCGRRYQLKVTPLQLRQGWAHKAEIIEVEESHRMKLLITSVDMDGYTGRQFHPGLSDVGKIVTALGMQTVLLRPDGIEIELVEEGLQPSPAAMDSEIALDDDDLQRVWLARCDDGLILQLMDHEVRVLDPMKAAF